MRQRIVVVEHSAELMRLFREVLVDAGYAVALAVAPPVALAQIADVRPALIILGYFFGREAAGWQLFQPFYRASNGRTRASGFGLGLYIIREIVERHGGRIAVESTEGQGSTFRVSIPVLLVKP